MKGLRLLALAAVAGSPAGAYLGEIVASFDSPAYHPAALATSGDRVYVFCGGESLPPFNTIFCLTTSGSRVSSFPSPFGSNTRGLGYEHGGYLWIGRCSPAYVARCNASTGSVYSSFPVTEHSLVGGIACQGDPTRPGPPAAIISGGSRPYLSARYTTAGSLLSSFATPRLFADPAWDYRNGVIWFPGNAVYAYTTTGSLAASFPINCYYPAGAAYAANYLYVSNVGLGPYVVYKVHCPSIWQRVAPTSIGRVKALFR